MTGRWDGPDWVTDEPLMYRRPPTAPVAAGTFRPARVGDPVTLPCPHSAPSSFAWRTFVGRCVRCGEGYEKRDEDGIVRIKHGTVDYEITEVTRSLTFDHRPGHWRYAVTIIDKEI